MLDSLNFNELITQTLSFTIVYCWRGSLMQCLKEVCPPELVKGPVGEIVFACLLTLMIIIIAYFYEEISKKYKNQVDPSLRKDTIDPDGPDGPDSMEELEETELTELDNELAMKDEVELDD